MPIVWFIRHGESESNIGLPTFRPENIQLTPKGIEQAKQVAAALCRMPNMVITSPYVRTQQTAAATLRRFPTVRREEWPVHEFTYLAPTSNAYSTVEDRRPRAEAFWRRGDPFYVDGEGAESFSEFLQRVLLVIERLKMLEEDFVVVFSHEQFIRALHWLLLLDAPHYSDRTMHQFKCFLTAFAMPNGAILKVHLQEHEEPWLSMLVTAHLSS